ncbi:MAG TPA: glutamate--tRNA ligase, partial [Firmicutes bacterium]|nr:glutamate--tRNA ligase [Bacillota bacterium]
MNSQSSSTVRVRIAPSPTGNCHVGTARTALYNMLYARKYGGKFILRIDDTDLSRSTRESEEGVLEGLRWLGITWDEGPDVGGPYGPYRQMERAHTYRETVDTLEALGKAYRCYCTPEELEAERKEALAAGKPPRYYGKCSRLTAEERARLEAEGKKHVVRLRVPDRTLSFVDLLRGDQQKDMSERGDFVIVKSDGSPVYNFATAVDEHHMAMTHVFRAVEHLTNTFDQLAVYDAMGWDPPQFGHLTLMLNPDRSKISKRAGAVYIGEFRDMGY